MISLEAPIDSCIRLYGNNTIEDVRVEFNHRLLLTS